MLIRRRRLRVVIEQETLRVEAPLGEAEDPRRDKVATEQNQLTAHGQALQRAGAILRGLPHPLAESDKEKKS